MPAILFQLCVPPIYFNAITSNAVSTDVQKDLLVATLAMGAIIDISLSAGLCALLWGRHIKGGSVLKSTNLMLQRIILFSVNTGMWTALAALVVILVFLRTETSDFMVFSYFHIMSPIYFVTVLANVNARPYLRGRDYDTASLPSQLFATSHGGTRLPDQAISAEGENGSVPEADGGPMEAFNIYPPSGGHQKEVQDISSSSSTLRPASLSAK